jgi:hypothetical protein
MTATHRPVAGAIPHKPAPSVALRPAAGSAPVRRPLPVGLAACRQELIRVRGLWRAQLVVLDRAIAALQ